MNQGKLIDSYDVVVRAGDFLRGDDVNKDYGSRTDILCHSFNSHDRSSFTEECYEDMKKYKFLIVSQISDDEFDGKYHSEDQKLPSGISSMMIFFLVKITRKYLQDKYDYECITK